MSKLEFKSKCSEPSYLYVQMYIKYLEGNVKIATKKFRENPVLHCIYKEGRQLCTFLYDSVAPSLL